MASTKKENGYVSSSYDDSDESEYYYPKSKKIKVGVDEEDAIICNYKQDISNNSQIRLPTRQPRCFTKNAVMARENRLRKKRYIEDLELQVTKLKHKNKTLSSILNNQSNVITELRKEVKYMKSILANSADISKLLKLINYNTGMSVSTSLNKSLTLTNTCFPKNEHIWDDINLNDSLMSPVIPKGELGILFDDPELYVNPIEHSILDISEDHLKTEHSNTTLKEHNYTINSCHSNDAGICLHVSNQRVSLEFCSTCSDNASNAWNGVELKL